MRVRCEILIPSKSKRVQLKNKKNWNENRTNLRNAESAGRDNPGVVPGCFSPLRSPQKERSKLDRSSTTCRLVVRRRHLLLFPLHDSSLSIIVPLVVWIDFSVFWTPPLPSYYSDPSVFYADNRGWHITYQTREGPIYSHLPLNPSPSS